VVCQLVQTWGCNESCQPLDEDQRIKNEVRCPVTKRCAKSMHNTTVGRERNTLVR
jgi:hypothetical protein